MFDYCSRCKGTGRIDNPAYPSKARALDQRLDRGFLPFPHYEAEIIRLFGSFDNLPEDSIECPECKGSGLLPVRGRRDNQKARAGVRYGR